MLPSVRVHDIEVALRVLETRHFTRVSAQLQKDQATISRCLRRVEQCLGFELIDRSTHPVCPTKAGIQFLYWGRKSLNTLQRGIREMRRVNNTADAVLDVGYTTFLDLDILTYLRHSSTNPDRGFAHHEHSSSTTEIIDAVRSRRWDCGFIISPAIAEGLAGIPICREPLGLMLVSDHPLTKKRKIKLTDLADVPLILPALDRNPVFRSWFVERCGTEGVTPRVAQEVSNPHEAGFLAAQRVGLALMPKSAAENLRKNGTAFRAFSAADLFAEVQLVFRDEPQTQHLGLFIKAALRMRERLLRTRAGMDEKSPPVVARPTVKVWESAETLTIEKLAASA